MNTKTTLQFRSILAIATALLCVIILSGCADAEPGVKACLEGHTYGFWGGLWHGFISPASFCASLFSDDIEVWAPNNNGGWYAFGFLLGAGALIGGGSSSSK